MSVMAYYGTRRGGSGGRTVKTAEEAEKILRGGYGVTNVRLVDHNGDEVGGRWKREGRWFWFYDQDAFRVQP
jgi:hypothetical protein